MTTYETVMVELQEVVLVTRWNCMVGFTLRPLYFRGKSSCFPLDRRFLRPHSRSGAAQMAEILPQRPNYRGGKLTNSCRNSVLRYHGKMLLESAKIFSADDIEREAIFECEVD
jgi:hypothetical protein